MTFNTIFSVVLKKPLKKRVNLRPMKVLMYNSHVAYRLRQIIAMDSSSPQCTRWRVRQCIPSDSMTSSFCESHFIVFYINWICRSSHFLFLSLVGTNKLIRFRVLIWFQHFEVLPKQNACNFREVEPMTT